MDPCYQQRRGAAEAVHCEAPQRCLYVWHARQEAQGRHPEETQRACQQCAQRYRNLVL